MISTTKSESLLTKTLISPLVPAGTIAALAVTVPVGALRVDTTGCVCPAGHVVKKPNEPFGTDV